MIKDLFKTNNFTELHNCWAVWIQKPENKALYFRTGASPCKTPFNQIESPYGMRAFISTEITDDKEVKKIERACSNYLSEHPEEYYKKADIFSELCPNIIKARIEKKKEKDQQTNATLNEFFEQKTLELNSPKTNNTINDPMVEVMCLMADKGAKTIKTPDGWEIQF